MRPGTGRAVSGMPGEWHWQQVSIPTGGADVTRIEEAIQKLEKITDRNICASRREELQEIVSLLKEEHEQGKATVG
jgi:hypothetical protein